jgi:hypothetical protein
MSGENAGFPIRRLCRSGMAKSGSRKNSRGIRLCGLLRVVTAYRRRGYYTRLNIKMSSELGEVCIPSLNLSHKGRENIVMETRSLGYASSTMPGKSPDDILGLALIFWIPFCNGMVASFYLRTYLLPYRRKPVSRCLDNK